MRSRTLLAPFRSRRPAGAKTVRLRLDASEDRSLPSGYFTTYLGSLGGYTSSASDVNATGQVVGQSSTAGRATGTAYDAATGTSVGFVWTPGQPNGTAGTMTTLASPSGASWSEPAGVNDANTVVGSAGYHVPPDPDSPGWPNGGYWTSNACVWNGGVAADLPATFVNGINARGQLAGAVSYEDGLYCWAVLLTPNDAPPTLTVGDATVLERNAGAREATFTVTRSAASAQTVAVAYATAAGTAAAGSDYQATSGTLTIPAGQTTGTITVLVYGDRLPEPNETLVVNLSGATNATIAHGQGVGTILDDEPRVHIDDVTRHEGRRGRTTLFTFTVTLSAVPDQAVPMSFRTADGTAETSDRDHLARTGTLGLFTKNRGVGTVLNDD